MCSRANDRQHRFLCYLQSFEDVTMVRPRFIVSAGSHLFSCRYASLKSAFCNYFLKISLLNQFILSWILFIGVQSHATDATSPWTLVVNRFTCKRRVAWKTNALHRITPILFLWSICTNLPKPHRVVALCLPYLKKAHGVGGKTYRITASRRSWSRKSWSRSTEEMSIGNVHSK